MSRQHADFSAVIRQLGGKDFLLAGVQTKHALRQNAHRPKSKLRVLRLRNRSFNEETRCFHRVIPALIQELPKTSFLQTSLLWEIAPIGLLQIQAAKECLSVIGVQ